MTYAEYAARERLGTGPKHEWIDGSAVAMSGGSRAHAQLPMNLGGVLYGQLRGGPCVMHSSDLRVTVERTGNSFYPDLTIVCGAPEMHPEDDHALLNPSVLVEVLSPTTETFDRGRKGAEYRTIDSLTDLLFVAQDRRHVEHWRRAEVGWHVRDVTDGTLELACGASVPLDALYEGIA